MVNTGDNLSHRKAVDPLLEHCSRRLNFPVFLYRVPMSASGAHPPEPGDLPAGTFRKARVAPRSCVAK